MSVSNRSFEAAQNLYHFWNTCGRKAETSNNINYTPAPAFIADMKSCFVFKSASPQMVVGGFCAQVLNRGKPTHIIFKAIFIKIEYWNTC